MKKIFTMVMLSIFTVMSAQADETTLWEGSTDINWGTSNVLIASATMADVPVGATIRLYFELVDMPENYHAMRITTNWWGDNPEDQVVAQFDLNPSTPNPFEFTYTTENKSIVDTREGMLIVGYGFNLKKVTYEVEDEQSDTEEQEVWKGDWWFSWEAANTDDSHKGWNAKDNGVDLTTFDDNQVIYIYLALETEDAHFFGNKYYQYRMDDSDWTALPGCSPTDVAKDTKVKLVVTPEIKAALTGRSLEVHGHGLRVVRLTKEVEKTTDGIVNVSTSDNYHPSPITQHPAFNLAGQRVSKNYKGVVIVNGKKYLNK